MQTKTYFSGIDFYSDTVTRPSPGMRKAMAEAEVGDEQKGEDPTTHRLEAKVAEMLGHTAAMFFPSATMANEIAIRLHCRPGEELIASEQCHLYIAEAGGPAVHAGVMCKSVRTETGIFTGADVEALFNGAHGPHYPPTRLVSVENTSNMGGGLAWPLEKLDGVLAIAKRLKLKTHLDGARLMNAAVFSKVPAARIAGGFDTATLCLSKGLGCPVGAVFVYDEKDYTEVRRLKQLFGGALRQSGILAAAGLYALENNVERLEEDHRNARYLADSLSQIASLRVETNPLGTNMVFFNWAGSTPIEAFLKRCEERGVRFSRVGEKRIRAVLHLDISRSQVEQAVRTVHEVCRES